MLTDRTYMLFRPRRSPDAGDRLNFRSSGTSGSASPLHGLIHSGSYDRLNNLGRTSDLSYTPSSPRLSRRTHTFSSADLRSNLYSPSSYSYTSPSSYSSNLYSSSYHNYGNNYNSSAYPQITSSNMEKREALMSSFARHTNTRRPLNSYSNGYSNSNTSSWLSSNPLPPRPKHSTFFNRFSGRSSAGRRAMYSPTHTNIELQEYFRPTIRQRPQFSAIRKSVMQKSTPHVSRTVVSPPTPPPSLNSSTTHRRSSVLSGGSSLSRSSSDSTGSLYQIENGRTSRPSSLERTSGESTPAELRTRSVRLVDRYRSVIKFQEHNFGKSLQQRHKSINWDLMSAANSTVASSPGHSSRTSISSRGVQNFIHSGSSLLGDGLTSACSTSTLSEADNVDGFSVSALEAQFAAVSKQRKTDFAETPVEGRRKLHKSYSQPTSGPEHTLTERHWSTKDVSRNFNDVKPPQDTQSVIEKPITQEVPEVIVPSQEEVKVKKEGRMKKMVRSAGKTFGLKRACKMKIKEDLTVIEKEDTVFHVEADWPAKRCSFARVPNVQTEVVTWKNFTQEWHYVPEVKSECVRTQSVISDSIRSEFCRPSSMYKVTIHLENLKGEYCTPKIEQKYWPPLLGDFHRPEITSLEMDPVKTEYASPEHITACITQPMQKSSYNYIVLEKVTCEQPVERGEYISVPSHWLHWSSPCGEFQTLPAFYEMLAEYLPEKSEYFTTSSDLNLEKIDDTFDTLENIPVKDCSDTLAQKSIDLSEEITQSSPLEYSSIQWNGIGRCSSKKPPPVAQISKKLIPLSKCVSLEGQACQALATARPPVSVKKTKKKKKDSEATSEKIHHSKKVSGALKTSESSPAANLPFGEPLPQTERIPLQVKMSDNWRDARPAGVKAHTGPRKRIAFRKYVADDFCFQSVLGRGSFGKVLLAELIGHNVYFAIKCFKKNVVIEDNDVESTVVERKVLALGSKNPFICKLFCTFQTPSYLCVAMEYLAGGDLMFHVQKMGRFTEERAKFYASEIVCALKFLHRRYIIYRDLKLDNIMLDRDGHIRLVDFGMCQCKTYRQECLPSNFCGTPDYMAPEIIKGIKYNHSVDWWSFGVLLYEMLIGKSPFTGADEDELLWNVCNEKIVFPLFLSKESVQIIALLLNRTPDKRLGMINCPAGDVTEQSFFQGINWQKADVKQLVPPFIPDLKSENDISNFDTEFTEAEPALTPIDTSVTNELDHQLFEGFSYTNPDMTD